MVTPKWTRQQRLDTARSIIQGVLAQGRVNVLDFDRLVRSTVQLTDKLLEALEETTNVAQGEVPR